MTQTEEKKGQHICVKCNTCHMVFRINVEERPEAMPLIGDLTKKYDVIFYCPLCDKKKIVHYNRQDISDDEQSTAQAAREGTQ